MKSFQMNLLVRIARKAAAINENEIKCLNIGYLVFRIAWYMLWNVGVYLHIFAGTSQKHICFLLYLFISLQFNIKDDTVLYLLRY